MYRKIAIVFAVLGAAAILNGCSVKYTFTGASIPQQARTFSVAYFPNNAAMVAPMLSNALTEGIKDRFQRQTRLVQVPENGDMAIEGEITGYMTAPAAVSADEYALLNRLTVTITVRFNNVYEPEWSFPNGRSFSAHTDYDASQLLQSVEGQLIEELVEVLVDNIFNATVANW